MKSRERITITLSKELVEKLKAMRETCAINVSGFINNAIVKYLQGVK